MILKTSKEILIENILCNHCLGRQFGKISTSTNERRGKVIKFKHPVNIELIPYNFPKFANPNLYFNFNN